VNHFFQLVGPHRAVQILGVKLVGVNAENGKKLLLSLILLLALAGINKALRALLQKLLPNRDAVRATFWSRQAIHLATAVILIVTLISIWFDDPTRLTTALGLVTAGVAFALQRVITAFAGYFVILRGKTFNV
jgi:small-conductance mechanosensitive channel